MANKITLNAVNAFYKNYDFAQSNTTVHNGVMRLWGNKILWKDSKSGAICFSLCGWDTHTTCERLRGAGLPINHKRGELYYDDIAINDCACYQINDDNTITQL